MLESYLGKSTWTLESTLIYPITLREVVEDILKMRGGEGTIYISTPEGMYSMAFSNGVATYKTDATLDNYRGWEVKKVQAGGTDKGMVFSIFLSNKRMIHGGEV